MFKFVINNGSQKEETIYGDFYDDFAVAEEKSVSVFVDKSLREKTCTFQTYRTDLKVGNIINARGLPYKITAVDIAETPESIISTVHGERYEN